MPQMIIHAENDGRARVKADMVNDLRTAMVKTLELGAHQGQVFLYEALPVNRAMAADRKSMIFVEIKMIEGRTEEAKQALAKEIVRIVSDHMELEAENVLCLFEEYAARAYVSGK